MNIRQDKLFLNGASAAAESKAALLENESVLTLEVTGTATEFTLKVMGRAADGQAQWTPPCRHQPDGLFRFRHHFQDRHLLRRTGWAAGREAGAGKRCGRNGQRIRKDG